jgi:hypothetical protein
MFQYWSFGAELTFLNTKFGQLTKLGNCDIHAEQKISFTNKTKQSENWSRQKG